MDAWLPSPPRIHPPPQPASSTTTTTTMPNTSDKDNKAVSDCELTPIRAHYLKKTLIQLEFHRELDALLTPRPDSLSTFSYLGSPFTRPPRDDTSPLDLPFLRYVFRQFILTFPFLVSAPTDFFSDKVQPFLTSLLTRSLFTPSSILEDADSESDQAGTNKLLAKAERSSALLLNYALKIAEPEQVVRLTQQDLDRLELLAHKRHARLLKQTVTFDVNIVSIRVVLERGRVRNRVHDEFIIRLRRPRYSDVFVSRRYGDFKTLSDELRKHHPEEEVKPPPAKDRSFVTAPGTTLSPDPSFTNSTESLPLSPVSPTNPANRLAREKNRLTLRAYLHSLLANPTLAASPVIQSFLTANPTNLSVSELQDARQREEADRQRDEGRKYFEREVAARVDALRVTLKELKGNLLGKDGLMHVFAVIKQVEDVRDLPAEFQAVLEWGRISLASTVFHHYVASDDASENIAGLKRIHGLMPYFLLKSALKISNPVSMIRTVLDLFTAQPFGGKSLLQRMFTSSLHEDVKGIREDIETVMDKVDDPMICEKLRLFAYAPRDIQSVYKADAEEENMHIFTAILRSPEEPVLSRPQLQRVIRAQRAHAEYMSLRGSLVDPSEDDGPHNEDAWLFEDLSLLSKLYSRLRDKEQLIELIFEGNTADLLKDIITIFYSPLAQIYKAANIADSIGDFQSFINDLIKTVDSAEDMTQEDPRRTVQVFIDLIQRHEQSFYSFVHKVHSKGEGLFNGFMRWIDVFLTVAREGLGEPISLEFLLPHTAEERLKFISEIDAVALYHYKLKIAYETKLRRRFGKATSGSGGAEDAAAQAIVNGFIRDSDYGDIMKQDAQDAAAEDSENDYEDSGDSDSYGSSDSDGSDGDETESSEDSQPRTATNISRSRTLPPPKTPTLPAVRDGHRTPTDTKGSRPRLLSFSSSGSLRRVRSLNLSDASTRRSTEVPSVPPVPPVPSKFTDLNKALPKNPAENLLRPPPLPPKLEQAPASKQLLSPAPNSRRSRSRGRTTSGKNQTSTLKPPELNNIPELLPLFVELIRPQLGIRPT